MVITNVCVSVQRSSLLDRNITQSRKIAAAILFHPLLGSRKVRREVTHFLFLLSEGWLYDNLLPMYNPLGCCCL